MNDLVRDGVDLPHEAFMVGLASLDEVGPATFRWLLSHGSPRRVWERVRAGRLTPGPGARVNSERIAGWMTQANSLDPARLWRRCVESGIGVVSLGSAGYPSDLADDPEPPVILFQRGDPHRLRVPRVAIVGTRRATGYGLAVARGLGMDLTNAGVSVVSGLAMGIDGAAHRGVVDAVEQSGSTVGGQGPPGCPTHAGPLAVVGANLEEVCPRQNRELARRVSELGVIYSEVPPGVRSAPWRFPVRNRLLAAMCDAVIVVESTANGGSMHTVREALSRDRTVFAVPGPVGVRSSEGTNQLLRDGAAPCLDVGDVLMELSVPVPLRGSGTRNESVGSGSGRVSGRTLPTGSAAAVLEVIGWRPVTLDGIATACGLGPRELAVVVSSLEADGWIVRNGSWIERVGR